MNNKLMSYEEAKEKLVRLEQKQKIFKYYRKRDSVSYGKMSDNQRYLSENKKEINHVLNIIHLHKQSRKLWAEKEYWKLKYIGVPCE